MPSASSPIHYPPSSSPAGALKRAKPHDEEQKQQLEQQQQLTASKPPKARVLGGFLADSDDEGDDNDALEALREDQFMGSGGLQEWQRHEQPAAKRRMLERQQYADGLGSVGKDGSLTEPTVNGNGVLPESSVPNAQQCDTVDTVDLTAQAAEEDENDVSLAFLSNPNTAALFASLSSNQPVRYRFTTCDGRSAPVRHRAVRRDTAAAADPGAYAKLVDARSKVKEGRARRAYYGVEVHALVDRAREEMKAEQEAKQRINATEALESVRDVPVASVEVDPQHDVAQKTGKKGRKKVDRTAMLWTEKYRARTFMDLVGDDLTNRNVLKWLKRWDPIVFPHSAAKNAKPRSVKRDVGGSSSGRIGGPKGGGATSAAADEEQERPHRKILLLAGPPGLGKTTLAHVCARQAGYEVLEINASDDRSAAVVRGRIRTVVGTESVKTLDNSVTSEGGTATGTKKPKVARPVCVVVDEVDGVVSGATGGSGGGEGGFVKALLDLVLLDQKNSRGKGGDGEGTTQTRRKKGGSGTKDDFRLLRPLILICNDVYAPALRPLRQSGLAEVMHVGKPSMDAVVARLRVIFEKEGIVCERDAAWKLCEAAWGINTAGNAGQAVRRGAQSTADGDLRSVMVVAEWAAQRARTLARDESPAAAGGGMVKMTRKFVDDHIIAEMAQGGVARGGLGRGGTREIVNRLFVEGAGFPPPGLVSKKTDAIASAATSVVSSARNTAHEQPTTQLSFSEHAKRYASERLCELIESNSAGGGNESTDRILTDAWAEYPLRDFNDDSFLSKPDAAYEWLYFHDVLQARVFANQDWELARYLAHPVVACHHLFASPRETMAGPSYLLEQQNQTRWGGGRQNQLHDDDDDADGGVDGRGNGKDGRPLPFSGPGADFAARAAERDTRAALQALQASLSPSLARAFRGPEDVAVGLLPWLVRMVSPDVKPVVVGGHPSGGGLGASGSDQKSAAVTSMASVRKQSEKIMVRRAAEILADFGVELVKGRLEDDGRWGNRGGAWVYRLEPDLDALASFESHVPPTTGGPADRPAPTRYAVRQVLEAELRRVLAQRENEARQARYAVGGTGLPGRPQPTAELNGEQTDDTENKDDLQTGPKVSVKRDFFGRVITTETTRTTGRQAMQERDGNGGAMAGKRPGSSKGRPASSHGGGGGGTRVWVTFHEGLNNAVRKPLSLDELLRGL